MLPWIAAVTLASLQPALAASKDSLTMLEWEGKYQELEKAAESRLAAVAARNTTTLAPLCVAYSRLKRYSKLMSCLNDLEQLVSGGDRTIAADLPLVPSSDATPLPNTLRADAYLELGEYSKAREEGKKALGKIKQELFSFGEIWSVPRYRIQILSTLALASALMNDSEGARKYVAELEGVSLPLANGAIWSSIRRYGIGKTYVALKDYKAAIESLRLEGFHDSFFIRNQYFTMADLARDLMMARAHLELGNPVEAKRLLDKLLANPRLADQGDVQWIALFERGRIAEAEQKAADAIGLYKHAVELIEFQRSTISTEGSKIGFVGNKQAVYRQLVAALHANQNYAEAFEYVERSKSRALVDMLAAKQDFAVPSGDPAKVRTLLATAGLAEAETLTRDADPERPQTRTLAISARQQLSTEAPELASLVNVSSLTTHQIQALIPADEALVEYYFDDPYLVAFVLTNKGLTAVRLDSRNLLDDVREFRKRLDSNESTNYLELAKRLHGQLIAPVIGQIQAGKLIVVAHGPLHYLPFNALHDGERYLIERYSLRMLPSASVLKYLSGRAVVKPGNVLAFGNPDLGNPSFDLVHAQAEAIAVTQNRPQSKVLLRKEANETAFRQFGSGFRYIHFATHGEFNAAEPLKSALLLAKDADSDGLLTVDKLYSLKLDADLVTLSACETGLGKIASGDDVVGLTRGFLYAGSRSIVASLWKVDDLATSYLMTRFYDNLSAGDKREALRKAQLDTLKKYPHPFYWAPFQITGSAD